MSRRTESTRFLKECMADALIKLLETTPPEHKITVSSIVQIAGVSTSTWFRNFSSKQEAICFKQQLLWERWVDEYPPNQKHNYLYENAATFFQYFYHYRDLYLLLYKTNLLSASFDTLCQLMIPPLKDGMVTYYQNVFYCYGLYGTVFKWIENDFHESPSEMTCIFYKYICQSAFSSDHTSLKELDFCQYSRKEDRRQ